MEYPSIAEQLRACGIDVPHRRAQEMILCPFHNERHPSFSVAHDKQLWFDFHDGEGGNRWQLAERLKEAGYDLCDLSLYKYKDERKSQVAQAPHGVRPPAHPVHPPSPDNEVLATCFEKMGLQEKAETVRDCAKYWTVYRCLDCGKKISNPLNCKSVFCDQCRQKRLKAFTRQHQEELTAWGGCKVFCYAFTSQETDGDGEAEAEKMWNKLQKKLPTIWTQLKRKEWLKSWIYHKRLFFGEDGWGLAFFFLVPLNDDDGQDEWFFYLSMALAELGFCYRAEEAFLGPFGALQAIETVAGAPFHYSTWMQFALLYKLMNGKRLIQGVGGAYRVRGGMVKGRGKEKKQLCPVCGGEMVFVTVVDRELITWDEEEERWTCDPEFLKALEDQEPPFEGRPKEKKPKMVNARLPF